VGPPIFLDISMKLVFFSHPPYLGSHSMPRFAGMLAAGMRERGHQVMLWAPQPRFYKIRIALSIKKWMGYVDQYLVFPVEVRSLTKTCPADTLFIFTDQALGPWVPLVAKRPHVIHCHDFLAQRSALGQIPENPVAWTGRRYQEMIRRGYTQGKNFISVSEKTQQDLHEFLPMPPNCSEVVYNGLNPAFSPSDPAAARAALTNRTGIPLVAGYLLHVGGNQWYKNRVGVIELYNAWRSGGDTRLPLLLVGHSPSAVLQQVYDKSPYKEEIHFVSGLEDREVGLAYAGASVFLFPSLAEGFGWPIAEAMASGCPVITTAEAPMNIVAGDAAFLIPRRPRSEASVPLWADDAARIIGHVVKLSPEERKAVVEAGRQNIRRFDACLSLDRIEQIYKRILQNSKAL
jgi:glycosyltransferase involved in cell wall biosynthesis